MSNDVYLIKKETLDNIVFAVDDVVQRAGGLTPEEIVEQLDALPRKTGSDCTITGNVVRVPEGLFQDWYDVTVPTVTRAETTLGVAANNANSIKITAVNSTQIIKTIGTAKTAATYTPGTTDQTINSGYFLTGAQTIKGDADLVAGNIKSGVQIFGVTGTYEGTGNYLNAESYTF